MAHFRHPKLLEERLALHGKYVVKNPEELAGQWRSLLPECNQLCVDLGCGKGLWTSAAANAWQDSLFVGVDHELMCVSFAAEQAAVGGVASSGWAKNADEGFVAPSNIRFVCAPASRVSELFAEGEIDHLFLNYPTPFPKKKETAKRIVNADHLRVYARLLASHGVLHFKTDSQPLFDYALEQLESTEFEVVALTRDLYNDAHDTTSEEFYGFAPASSLDPNVTAAFAKNTGANEAWHREDSFEAFELFDDVDRLPSAYERKTLMRGAKIHALHARVKVDSICENGGCDTDDDMRDTPVQASSVRPVSLYDYLPDDLDAIAYVPLGMENALINMRNRRRNGHGGVWGE